MGYNGEVDAQGPWMCAKFVLIPLTLIGLLYVEHTAKRSIKTALESIKAISHHGQQEWAYSGSVRHVIWILNQRFTTERKLLFKALRELLIRMDSMDTRLWNYGENLRRLNSTLLSSGHRKLAEFSTNQTAYIHTIDGLNFDDTTDDPLSRSRSCNETSFFEVLDEINSTVAQPPEKFLVGTNKRVQIVHRENRSHVTTGTAVSQQPASATQDTSNTQQKPSASQATSVQNRNSSSN